MNKILFYVRNKLADKVLIYRRKTGAFIFISARKFVYLFPPSFVLFCFRTRHKVYLQLSKLLNFVPPKILAFAFIAQYKFMNRPYLDPSRFNETLNNLSGDRDQLILKHILKMDVHSSKLMPMNHASAHIGISGRLRYFNFDEPISLKDFNEGKERIVLVINPCWGVIFSPYGLSKITGMLRKEGYACKIYDLNIQLYHNLLRKTGQDFWRSEKYFFWQDEWFFQEYILKEIEPFLNKAVEKIANDNPSLVGFSLYATNNLASGLMIKKLRERLPNVPIVVGGPAVITDIDIMKSDLMKDVNYFFTGESEETFLQFLNNGTHLKELPKKGVFLSNTNTRISLNDKAFADFSDYDLNAYLHKDGVSIETSRGCVAECSFCSETKFWKFRSMSPERVIEEMKFQVKTFGIKRFWFVDSLVNGNLKNFQKLVDLILEAQINIKWNSYSRFDGRMTREFLKKVSESGCSALSYGLESGSQKVLNDMRKRIDIWEIEANLKDTHYAGGIFTHVNMIIGFPTEEYIDYYHTLVLTFNVRNYVHYLSPGMGCDPGTLTDLLDRYQLYGIAWGEKAWEKQLFDRWFTHGFTNTQLNRFIRLKLYHIWLEILKHSCESLIENSQRHSDIKDSFKFKSKNKSSNSYLVQDVDVDFARIKAEASDSIISTFAANEFFPIFYSLFKIFGGFEMTILFDSKKDIRSWGSIAMNYDSIVLFEIDNAGNYKFSIDHELKHIGLTPATEEIFKLERESEIGDKSFKNTFTDQGNVASWKTNTSLVKNTIHPTYRDTAEKIPV